ncbi:putative protein NRT1/ PTR FAMILY 2.2 isoform X2 [Asparagus officinalis]|uniref:putative protein NRT1/ PTR FAMILY 2.2 isoform X2 n=1 Tax=Asparagus officinalis TaxID=4686 RepID=UPI00098E3C73|nr:putative protein NRT1/ PTR FAMILY 2.2 isoform X2 [Asparagus officinalis]
MAIDEALMTYADPVVGGRKTFPFIVAAVVGVGIGAYATLANSGIYLMEKYNVSPVDGSVIASVFVGSTNLAPVVGGVISDTCLSCFAVISVACAACFLGMLLFTLTAIFPSLRPPSCTYSPCQGPTTWQFAILFMALALMTVGLGGTRFTGAAMGAAQFGDENDRDTFFSWYLVAMYISSIIGIVGIVYIQANLGWVLGFGVCAVIAAVGFVIFLLGNRYYRHPKPQENPLVDIFRQILSRAGKRKAASESSERLLCCSKVDDGAVEPQTTIECPRYGFILKVSRGSNDTRGQTRRRTHHPPPACPPNHNWHNPQLLPRPPNVRLLPPSPRHGPPSHPKTHYPHRLHLHLPHPIRHPLHPPPQLPPLPSPPLPHRSTPNPPGPHRLRISHHNLRHGLRRPNRTKAAPRPPNRCSTNFRSLACAVFYAGRVRRGTAFSGTARVLLSGVPGVVQGVRDGGERASIGGRELCHVGGHWDD